MDVIEFLESKETYKKVYNFLSSKIDKPLEEVSELEVLGFTNEEPEELIGSYYGTTKLKKIKTDGFICGGSVANTLNWLLHGVEPVINDIDIFYLDNNHSTPPKVDNLEDEYVESIKSSSFPGEKIEINFSQRKGLLNFISTRRNDFLFTPAKNLLINNQEFQKRVLNSFDLNACRVGLDLKEEKIIYSEDFVEFLKGRQLKIVLAQNPLQTAIRVFTKIDDLKCYCDVGEELNILKHIFFCVDRSFTIRFSKTTFEKYLKVKDKIDKHFDIFKIEEPSPEKQKNSIKYSQDEFLRLEPVVNRGLYIKDKELWSYTPIMDKYDPPITIDFPNQVLNYFRFKSKKTPKSVRNKFKKFINHIIYIEKNCLEITGKTYYNSTVEASLSTIHSLKEEKKLNPHNKHFFSKFNKKVLQTKNPYLSRSLHQGIDYLDCDFHTKNIEYITKFYNEHSRMFNIMEELKLIENLQKEVEAIKIIKSVVNKKGLWVIGELENINAEGSIITKYCETIDELGLENFLLEFIKEKEEVLKETLTDPIDLSGFEYENCVQELTTLLDLKNEGTKMGHCVGGYSDAIKNGSSKIFHIECDGIGSTVEIGFNNPWGTRFGYSAYMGVPDSWKSFAEVNKEAEHIISQISQINMEAYTTSNSYVKQHQGRYPEAKGNQTPTETNNFIVEELCKFIDKTYYRHNRLKDLLLKKFDLECDMLNIINKNKSLFEGSNTVTKEGQRIKELRPSDVWH